MYKAIIILVTAAAVFSACGYFGSGDSNSNADSNVAVIDDPAVVPKFEDARSAIVKGDEYLDASLYKQAIAAYKQAAELEPENGEAHFKLGVAYALQEDLEDLPPGVEGNSDKAFKNAVTVYKKYVKENSEDAAAWFNLGRAQGKLFEDKESANSIGKAVKLDDENVLYKTEYGAALIKLAQYREAIRELEKVLEMDPENLYAEDLLEKAQAGKKRVDFKQPEKKPSDANSNMNENGPAESSSPQSNTATKPAPPPQPAKTVPPPPPPPGR